MCIHADFMPARAFPVKGVDTTYKGVDTTYTAPSVEMYARVIGHMHTSREFKKERAGERGGGEGGRERRRRKHE